MVCNGDHPRLRGEYRVNELGDASVPGSPPLARGIQGGLLVAIYEKGITPACAGNTLMDIHTRFLIRDHPRLRGEYDTLFYITQQFLGSPPLARGIPVTAVHGLDKIGITPACAGNTPRIAPGAAPEWDHPRLRGEYENTGASVSGYQGSPPLARGIH